MGKTRAAYPPEFRRQMVDLVRRPNPSRVAHLPHDSGGRTRSRCIGRIQLIVATRSLLAYRATRRPTPRSLTVTLDEFISIAGYHRKHVIWRRCFRRCWWPTNLDKHSAVLGLVQDEPALRAGAAGGILDKTCARRSAGGRSAPRNGPLSLTKECNLDLGSGEGGIRSHGDIPTRSVPDVA